MDWIISWRTLITCSGRHTFLQPKGKKKWQKETTGKNIKNCARNSCFTYEATSDFEQLLKVWERESVWILAHGSRLWSRWWENPIRAFHFAIHWTRSSPDIPRLLALQAEMQVSGPGLPSDRSTAWAFCCHPWPLPWVQFCNCIQTQTDTGHLNDYWHWSPFPETQRDCF